MKFLTAKQVAEKYGVTKRVVQGWCERGLLPNAKKVDSGFGFDVWQIPERDLENFVKPEGRGKPRLDNPSAATLAKRRSREK
ncbi:MAG: helix-turn-helix domain-containing protein [Bacteroidetes bacterium]|nr:helix-turn-helix domain-containing protein [Bacteroidota bacterium]